MPTPELLKPQPYPWIVLGAILTVVAFFAGWLTRDSNQFLWVYRENGLLEAAEVVLNALVSFLFVFRAWKHNDMVGAWCIVVAAAFAIAALHEFPRCGRTIAEMDACIPAPVKKSAFAAIAALAAIALLYRRQNPIESLRPRWILLFWPLVITLFLFGLSQIADKFDLISYEEFFELSGGLAALALAVWIVRRT